MGMGSSLMETERVPDSNVGSFFLNLSPKPSNPIPRSGTSPNPRLRHLKFRRKFLTKSLTTPPLYTFQIFVQTMYGPSNYPGPPLTTSPFLYPFSPSKSFCLFRGSLPVPGHVPSLGTEVVGCGWEGGTNVNPHATPSSPTTSLPLRK